MRPQLFVVLHIVDKTCFDLLANQIYSFLEIIRNDDFLSANKIDSLSKSLQSCLVFVWLFICLEKLAEEV